MGFAARLCFVIGSIVVLCVFAGTCSSDERSVEKSREVKKVRVVPYVEPPRMEPPGSKAVAADGAAAAAPASCHGGACGVRAKTRAVVSRLRIRKG